MSTCDICAEKFHKRRTEIKCPGKTASCELKACNICCERWLRDQTNAFCMGCGLEWNREFINEQFPTSFINNSYKLKREEICYSREEARFPQTQTLIAADNEFEKLLNDRENARTQTHQLWKDKYVETVEQLKLKIQGLETEWRQSDISKKFQSLNQKVRRGKQRMQQKKYIKKCLTENCDGCLDDSWECSLCLVKYCERCREPLDNDSHECNEDTVLSISYMEKDSKPCPKCGIQIFKIEGCNHMWCTQCHTSFHWITGSLMSRTTNPHYYNWIRENHGNLAREEGDIPCDEELPAMTRIISALHYSRCMPNNNNTDGSVELKKTEIYNKIAHLHRCVNHIRNITLHGSRFNTSQIDNIDYRKRYLKHTMSVEEFKHKIQVRDKAQEKKASNRLIIEMFCAVGVDILIRIDRTPPCTHDENSGDSCITCEEILYQITQEITNLINYTNSRLDANSKLYNMSNHYYISHYLQRGLIHELTNKELQPDRRSFSI